MGKPRFFKRHVFQDNCCRTLRDVTVLAVILLFFLVSAVQAFPPSITGGQPKGAFGSGGQTDDVTEPENWRWSEWFYGHRGIDRIEWRYDACGGRHNYAMGWHGNDLIEYLMKFGGRYSRLILLGIADRPGPVELAIYIDGQYKASAVWDNNNDCNEDVAVAISGIPYGIHAIAVQFVNDYYNPPEDRNFYLDGLLVNRPYTPPPPPPTSELYGLCVNANYAEQNPPAREFSDLGVHWARSIRYQSGFTPDQRNVKWLVIFNQETIPRGGGETWRDYVERFSNEVRNIVQANDWISAVEVWNEQDLPGEGRYLTPQEYAGLLRATYQKVKGLSDPPLVVVGGLATGAWAAADYLQQVKNEWGGAIYFDAVGLHPYLAVVDGIGWPDRGLMEDHINHFYQYTSGRPIWLTEFGAAYQHLGNDKERQGLYLEKCYQLFERLKDGSNRKVEVAFWFAWDDRTHWDPAHEGFGLVELDHSRRPAWWRYHGLTHQ